MAPEQLDCNGEQYNREVDNWSFGCLVSELITKRKLFDGDDVNEIHSRIMKFEGYGNYYIKNINLFPNGISIDFIQIIDLILQKNPS